MQFIKSFQFGNLGQIFEQYIVVCDPNEMFVWFDQFKCLILVHIFGVWEGPVVHGLFECSAEWRGLNLPKGELCRCWDFKLLMSYIFLQAMKDFCDLPKIILRKIPIYEKLWYANEEWAKLVISEILIMMHFLTSVDLMIVCELL